MFYVHVISDLQSCDKSNHSKKCLHKKKSKEEEKYINIIVKPMDPSIQPESKIF